MEIVYAYLASYAEFSPDGRLTMVGGDLESMLSEQFPSRQYNFTLAIKTIVPATEAGHEHPLRIEIVRVQAGQPDGAVIPPTIEGNMNLPPIIGEANSARANLVGQFTGVVFPEEGEYFVRVLIDGQERKRIPLRLIKQPPTTTG